MLPQKLKKVASNSRMDTNIWKRALVAARGNRLLRPLGRRLLKFPAAGQVLRQFMHGVMPRGKRVWVQISAGPAEGLWLKVEPYLEEQYLTGCPEPAVQACIMETLQPGDCFYDVGAHIGYYSMVAARRVGVRGRVIAFEPDPANVETLQGNLSRNGLSQVEVIGAAVWKQSGDVSFQRSARDSPTLSSRRGRVVPSSSSSPASSRIRVESVSLDEFAPRHGFPKLIKIDVEGAEVEVLQGARKLVARSSPILLIEVHHLPAADFLENQLRQDGYSLQWLERHPKFPFPRHLLAWPRP